MSQTHGIFFLVKRFIFSFYIDQISKKKNNFQSNLNLIKFSTGCLIRNIYKHILPQKEEREQQKANLNSGLKVLNL